MSEVPGQPGPDDEADAPPVPEVAGITAPDDTPPDEDDAEAAGHPS